MRGLTGFLGVLLLIAGGAVAAVQFVELDLSSYLSSVPAAQEFLDSPTALYAGGGAAALGLLLVIVAMASGRSKKTPRRSARSAEPVPPKSVPAQPAPTKPAPAMAAPEPQAAPPAQEPRLAPRHTPAPQAAAAGAAPRPAAKPQASAHPPPSAQGTVAAAVVDAPTWTQDPRLQNRRRVSDLVALNDALKAYHARHGAYPRAEGLQGQVERGAAWIPGLAPDFIKELPRDPAQSDDPSASRYVYASNGVDYKLLAHGVALAGGTNVEVLGVRIDNTRNPTVDKASFGFWTEGFTSV